MCHEEPDLTEEKALAESFARGEPAAFDRVVRAYQQRVARLASRLLGWRGDVDDVAQDVFLTALRRHRSFRGQSRLLTWLLAITVHKCRAQRWRAWRRWLWSERPETRYSPQADAEPIRDETAQRVRQAIQDLRPAEREVSVLYYLEGMPVAQIAVLLRIAPNTIDVRLHRARQHLREELADLAEDSA